MFSTVQDPDYAGHVILEQFQAQVTPSILTMYLCCVWRANILHLCEK